MTVYNVLILTNIVTKWWGGGGGGRRVAFKIYFPLLFELHILSYSLSPLGVAVRLS